MLTFIRYIEVYLRLRFWIVFVITRISLNEVRYIEVLFHVFCCNFGRAEENCSLYRRIRYKEVPQY